MAGEVEGTLFYDSRMVTDPAPLLPADRLRLHLLHGSGRWLLAFSVVCIWLLDRLLSEHLANSGVMDPGMVALNQKFEQGSTVIFAVISVVLLLALFKPWPRLLFPSAAAYLTFSVLQVAANVFSMVATAHVKSGVGLQTLGDVAAVYGLSVLVFMFIYVLLDVSTPGGAFIWPTRHGESAPTPHLLDYLFISLNVNSTYGPTSEAVMSRPGKLIMALQTLLALVMLTVLIARAVGSTS